MLILLVALCASTAMSATKLYKTRILQTSLNEPADGGCAVKLAKPPSEAGLVCDGPWVHFSCNGDINSQAEGYQKFQAGQLSLISGTAVKVRIDDDEEKKIGGNCYADRIDNFPN